MMYELNWCGIYMPIWLVCLILGGLLSAVFGKLIQLILRQTKLLTVDYASLAVIFAFVFWSAFFGER
jgi:YtcA family